MFFTVELFIDALILVLHTTDSDARKLVQELLDLYAKEERGAVRDTDFYELYVGLIKEVMSKSITVNDEKEIEAMVLKLKSHPVLVKDPELYTNLKKIFTDKEPLPKDRFQTLLRRMSNTVLWHKDTTVIKKMYGALANNAALSDVNQQETVLTNLSTMCSELIQQNTEAMAALDDKTEETRVTFVDSADKSGLLKALHVYHDTTIAHTFKTGLQGFNRAIGGGFRLGSSIVLNSLSHHAKCTTNRTLIKIPGGWKKMGDMQVGDIVTAWDGTPSKVIGVYPQGVIPVYRMTFSDGRYLDISGNHLWTIYQGDEPEVIDTDEIRERMSTTEEAIYIPLCKSEQIDDVELPEDPYDVGLTARECNNGRMIPELYHNTSHSQRVSLFLGLMKEDREGSLASSYKRATTDDVLAKEITFIARSLGGTCCVTEEVVNDQRLFNLDIRFDQNKLRIVDITLLPEKEDCTCIRIDHPDMLFVAGDFVVTHNSLMLLKFARWQVTLNPVGPQFKNPTCLFYSLENETPQNLVQMFTEMYINNERKLPTEQMLADDEFIANYVYDEFGKYGWKLIIDRRLGANFGFPELVADFEEYLSRGFTPLMCVIDYMNMMRKGRMGADTADGNHLLVRDLYTNVCNYLKSHNCTLVTAHQLNRKAAEAARMNPLGAVKRFSIDMLSDSTDPQREVDIAIYQHKEFDAQGNAYLTFKVDKVRYNNDIPDKDKYFAYAFHGPMGILDDVAETDRSIDNIYAYDFAGESAKLYGQENVPAVETSDKPKPEAKKTVNDDGDINLY